MVFGNVEILKRKFIEWTSRTLLFVEMKISKKKNLFHRPHVWKLPRYYGNLSSMVQYIQSCRVGYSCISEWQHQGHRWAR